jgi:hypothetical protein
LNGTERKLYPLSRERLMRLAHNITSLQALLTDCWLNDEGPISKRLAQRIRNEMAIEFLTGCHAGCYGLGLLRAGGR